MLIPKLYNYYSSQGSVAFFVQREKEIFMATDKVVEGMEVQDRKLCFDALMVYAASLKRAIASEKVESIASIRQVTYDRVLALQARFR